MSAYCELAKLENLQMESELSLLQTCVNICVTKHAPVPRDMRLRARTLYFCMGTGVTFQHRKKGEYKFDRSQRREPSEINLLACFRANAMLGFSDLPIYSSVHSLLVKAYEGTDFMKALTPRNYHLDELSTSEVHKLSGAGWPWLVSDEFNGFFEAARQEAYSREATQQVAIHLPKALTRLTGEYLAGDVRQRRT
jgi:hypothetical protein